ncbi:MAG: 4-hydroxybenzoate octaprenyltransferase [Thermoplasmata archaeon]
MTDAPSPPRGPMTEFARFLELQNLGLNLSFALAFVLLAARGWPPLVPLLLIVVAFVAARNAGHSFNRLVDRFQDAANPRTRHRALVTGRYSPAFALAVTGVSGAVLIVAAYLLNPLAFLLSPVALAAILGYSYTKPRTAATTAYLGLVEAIPPVAIYIALTGTLPWVALLAAGALLLWGTAFETVHSLGDIESDRALHLQSLPLRIGVPASVRLVPILHGAALALLAVFGGWLGLSWPYFAGLAAMAVVAGITDMGLARDPTHARTPFQRHFLMGLLFLAGVAAALLVVK